MGIDEGVADLHVHTTASDGTSPISDRIDQARKHGLDAIAITDHDIVAERLTTKRTHTADVELITGVEVRADIDNTKVEILGYYVDPTDEEFRSLLQRLRQYREERNRELVANVNRETPLDLSYEELTEETVGTLGRPYLAEILREEDIVSSIGAAFDEYLAEDGRCFVPMQRVPVDKVIATIRNAGGVTSLAHPGRVQTDVPSLERHVRELASSGLDAIEVKYPYGEQSSDRYVNIGVEDARRLAEEHELAVTGGSDCHGPDSGKFRIGSVRVPDSALQRIKRIADSRCSLTPTR